MAREATQGRGEEREGGSIVGRSLDLIEAIARAGRALTAPELCALLGVPKPTVHRLCQRLEHAGYLAREPGGRHFAAGPRLVRLGLDVMRWNPTVERRAIVRSVVDEIGETVNLTALANDQVFYLDRIEARWPLRLLLEPGSRVPLHCTASGKLFLATMAPARRARVLDEIELTPFTVHTITDRARLEAELRDIAGQDYSLDRQEFLMGLNAVAVPVRSETGAVIAAIACHAPSARLDLAEAIRHIPKLRVAAARLAQTLPE
ncbi:MAG TPA: IclR family transcriptional regulator [Acidiphilium sp.]